MAATVTAAAQPASQTASEFYVRDGIIIEFFLNVRQEGTLWKIER